MGRFSNLLNGQGNSRALEQGGWRVARDDYFRITVAYLARTPGQVRVETDSSNGLVVALGPQFYEGRVYPRNSSQMGAPLSC
jgi:hypothetical protein